MPVIVTCPAGPVIQGSEEVLPEGHGGRGGERMRPSKKRLSGSPLLFRKQELISSKEGR